MDWLLEWLGRRLAKYLSEVRPASTRLATSPPETLAGSLEPGDVLLIEGNTRISVAIKYLTQSTWSHSALYIGDAAGPGARPARSRGCSSRRTCARACARCRSAISRACTRASAARSACGAEEVRQVVDFAVSRIGEGYDMKNVIDLARYLLPTPPVPTSFRRRLIALGSGDPTRAICSTLIAEAFGAVRYPILPIYVPITAGGHADRAQREMLRIRHHSLYVPRDFDISPYFAIVKPTIAQGFDFHQLRWEE